MSLVSATRTFVLASMVALFGCRSGPSGADIARAESVYTDCMADFGFQVTTLDLTPGRESVELAPHDASLEEVLEAVAECERRAGEILGGDAAITLLGDDLQADVDTVVSAADEGGVVAVLVRDGERVEAVAGTADEAGTSLGVGTLFNVASVSKTYTATLVYQLEDEGLLDTDAALSVYLPEQDFGPGVTLDSLLSHRSGVPDYTANPAYLTDVLEAPDRIFTPAELLDYATFEAPSPPGVRFAYSNTGYVLLGLVIEEVTGDTLAGALEAGIVTPLGLVSTSLVQPPVFPSELASAWLDPVALGLPPKTTLPVMPVAAPLSGCQADCGILTTSSELGTFFTALFAGDLVSDKALAEMMRSDADAPHQGRGLEVYVQSDGERTFGHGGGGSGYSARVAVHPTSRDLTLVLANNDVFEVDALFELYRD